MANTYSRILEVPKHQPRRNGASDSSSAEPFSSFRCSSLVCNNECGYIVAMVLELKLRKIGNSVGVVLPKEALARLNAGEGDLIYATETTDGGFRLTASDPSFVEKLKAAQNLSRRYRHALKELAK